MEKKKLTFMPDGNNTYAGFDGAEIVALVVPYYPSGECGPHAWQWSARSECGQRERTGWAFPGPDSRPQREVDVKDAMRRAAQYVGHVFFHPVGLCPDDCPDCPDCPSVVILPPKEVDR